MENQVTTIPATQQYNNTTSVNFFNPVQFETAQRMSKMFASSKLVPNMYQKDEVYKELQKDNMRLPQDQRLDAKTLYQNASIEATANCMIALDVATRIGASPLMIMQNLVIIYGRPSWSSKFLIATINTCGRFEPLKYKFIEKGKVGKINITEYVWDRATNSKKPVTREFDGTKIMDIECVAFTKAKGSNEVLESSPISIRMAIEEGWYTKNGSKWQTMPKQMLMYRAASFWTSAYAPEISMGMRTIEEEEDIEYVELKAGDDEKASIAQLKAEKEQLANKKVVDLTSKNPSANEVEQPETQKEEVVDKETGEVLTKENAPKENPTQNMAGPGF